MTTTSPLRSLGYPTWQRWRRTSLPLPLSGAARSSRRRLRHETLATDSLLYVQVPYDVLLSYFCRCHDLVLCTPESRRLQLLQHLDVEERGQWAARCTGATTLGVIIGAVMRERDALWLTGHCQHLPSLRVRHRVGPRRPQLRLDKLELWSSASATGPGCARRFSAISAAPRSTENAVLTAAGLSCSQGAFADRSSARQLPKGCLKRGPLLCPGGARGQPLDNHVFKDFRSFWMNWSPLTYASPKNPHALSSSTSSAVSMPPCPRFSCGANGRSSHPSTSRLTRTWTCRVHRAIRGPSESCHRCRGHELCYQVSGS